MTGGGFIYQNLFRKKACPDFSYCAGSGPLPMQAAPARSTGNPALRWKQSSPSGTPGLPCRCSTRQTEPRTTAAPPFSASASLPRRWESPRWKKGTTPATTGPEWQKGEAGRGKPRHQNGYGDIPLAPQAGKHAPQALHGQRGNRRRGPPAGARRYGLPVPRPVNRIKNTGGKELACPRFFAHLRQQVKPDFAHQLPVAVFHPPQSLL